MARLQMHRRGTTTGAESGAEYRWEMDEVVEEKAEGDLRHLNPAHYSHVDGGAYQTRPMRPARPEASVKEAPAAVDWETRVEAHHVGGGWYDVGLEKKVRKEEAIEALKHQDQ